MDNVFLKREDLNQTGSAKDRAIIYQIQNLKKKGFDSAVISSTGNAAISAAYYCQQEQISLTVFLSPKVNQNKLDLLKKSKCRLFFSKKPISDAIKFSKLNNSYLWYHPRRSTDAFFDAYMMNNPWKYNPFPEFNDVYEMHQWIEPLLLEENKSI